jgi:hypothetical protein
MKFTDEYTREDVRNLQTITFICIMIAVVLCTIARVVGLL